jgi:hypothetical protein
MLEEKKLGSLIFHFKGEDLDKYLSIDGVQPKAVIAAIKLDLIKIINPDSVEKFIEKNITHLKQYDIHLLRSSIAPQHNPHT